MSRLFRSLRRLFLKGRRRNAANHLALEILEDRWLPSVSLPFGPAASSASSSAVAANIQSVNHSSQQTVFVQTNLVSDIPGLAATTDPNLVNPWGISFSPMSPFWISDNGAGVSTLYNGQGQAVPLVVTIPSAPGNSESGTPTGTVFNSFGTGFNISEGNSTGSAVFLFATEDGTISGWNPNVDHTNAIRMVYNADSGGAVYKGLAIGADAGGDKLLYAANFRTGNIDVYGSNFQPVQLAGSFQDANIPAGFAAFDVQNIGGSLYVTYAKQDGDKHDDVSGPGNGFVDVFNTDGQLVKRLIQGGVLNSPWGITMAPANFGGFANDLLVGNFGDGRINAFDPKNGKFLGAMTLANGQPFQEVGLWALQFGNGHSGPANTLFFTAGINGEADGLFGSVQAAAGISRDVPLLSNLSSTAHQSFSTVPPNGDVNPYGIAFLPQSYQGGGVLQPGDLLVSNFNDGTNTQGTGTTIVRFTPDGQHSVFFQGAPGLGLTTALGVLKNGFVIVGNLPTDVNGNPQQGSLLILDAHGNLVEQFTDAALLNGPWDLTVNDQGGFAQVFVSNVLSGTVSRLNLVIPSHGNPSIGSKIQIASGYVHRTDPAALVIGPTGLAFDAARDILYVASTGDNAIFAVANAAFASSDHGIGQMIYQDATHLHGPLGLVLAPNGNLITANGDAVNPNPYQPNELVEFTPGGQFVGQFQVDSGPGGGAFGLAISTDNGAIRFAAVDDDTNTVLVWTFQQSPPFSKKPIFG